MALQRLVKLKWEMISTIGVQTKGKGKGKKRSHVHVPKTNLEYKHENILQNLMATEKGRNCFPAVSRKGEGRELKREK